MSRDTRLMRKVHRASERASERKNDAGGVILSMKRSSLASAPVGFGLGRCGGSVITANALPRRDEAAGAQSRLAAQARLIRCRWSARRSRLNDWRSTSDLTPISNCGRPLSRYSSIGIPSGMNAHCFRDVAGSRGGHGRSGAVQSPFRGRSRAPHRRTR